MSDLRVLRERQLIASSTLDRSGDLDTHGSPALIVKTTTATTYPVVPTVYYACLSQQITGPETEGASPAYTDDNPGQVIYALNLGTQIPPATTLLVVHGVGGRWAFRYDG